MVGRRETAFTFSFRCIALDCEDQCAQFTLGVTLIRIIGVGESRRRPREVLMVVGMCTGKTPLCFGVQF